MLEIVQVDLADRSDPSPDPDRHGSAVGTDRKRGAPPSPARPLGGVGVAGGRPGDPVRLDQSAVAHDGAGVDPDLSGDVRRGEPVNVTKGEGLLG